MTVYCYKVSISLQAGLFNIEELIYVLGAVIGLTVLSIALLTAFIVMIVQRFRDANPCKPDHTPRSPQVSHPGSVITTTYTYEDSQRSEGSSNPYSQVPSLYNSSADSEVYTLPTR